GCSVYPPRRAKISRTLETAACPPQDGFAVASLKSFGSKAQRTTCSKSLPSSKKGASNVRVFEVSFPNRARFPRSDSAISECFAALCPKGLRVEQRRSHGSERCASQ